MDDQQDAETLWQLTMENCPIGMCLVGLDGDFLTVNRAFALMLGRTVDQLAGRHFHEVTHTDDLDADLELLQECLAGTRSTYRMTKRYFHADGSTVWGDLSVVLVRSDVGEPRHFISQIVDVTADRLRTQALSEALAQVDLERRTAQTILDTVDVGLVLIDAEGRYERTNRRHQDFMALAFPAGHDGMAGALGEVYAADGVTEVRREDMPSIRATSGREFDDDVIWVGSDPDDRRALSVSARSRRGADGELEGAALAYKDITDLMLALAARDKFVADVSHELRTPLASVLGHLELLLDDDVPPHLATSLATVQRNALRLRKLVGDLLDTAAHRDRGLHLTRATTDAVGIVRDAVEAATPTAQAAGVAVVALLPRAAWAPLDGDRIRQVVDNLLSNAIKYSDDGGTVTIDVTTEVRHDGGELVVSIADDGIGIAADDVPQLFTPYFRADEARSRAAPGAGLGLGITRAIVTAHGGRLDVTSVLGVGTTVRVVLPLEAT